MSDLFGVWLCYIIMLWACLLCVGGCKWRVRVAMCQFHSLGKVELARGVLVAWKYVHSVASHGVGVSGF